VQPRKTPEKVVTDVLYLNKSTGIDVMFMQFRKASVKLVAAVQNLKRSVGIDVILAPSKHLLKVVVLERLLNNPAGIDVSAVV